MGLVRYIGMSSCYAYQFHAMQAYAASRNVSLSSPFSFPKRGRSLPLSPQQTKFISMQDFYNPVYREEEREMFPTCKVRRSPVPGPTSFYPAFPLRRE